MQETISEMSHQRSMKSRGEEQPVFNLKYMTWYAKSKINCVKCLKGSRSNQWGTRREERQKRKGHRECSNKKDQEKTAKWSKQHERNGNTSGS